MHLPYILIDERIDAVFGAERRSTEEDRAEFRRRFLWSWIFHELSLEGASLTLDDMTRAMQGLAGENYCDGVRLDSIRSFNRAIQDMKDGAFRGVPLSLDVFERWHVRMSGTCEVPSLRTTAGATEAYKHDVVEPDRVAAELERVLAKAQRASMTSHPIQVAVRLHHDLIRVWPFATLSGAIARMAGNHVLLSNGYPPCVINVSERQRYYHALHYDITRLHDLVVESVDEQLALRERVFRRRVESAAHAHAY